MADPMKFNASTDPKLSEIELTNEQIDAALNLHEQSVGDRSYLACREIIALRAAVEQHAEALRAAKLAGWEAGRRDAVKAAARQAAFRYGPGAQTKEMEDIAQMRAPTPSQLDEIR